MAAQALKYANTLPAGRSKCTMPRQHYILLLGKYLVKESTEIKWSKSSESDIGKATTYDMQL